MNAQDQQKILESTSDSEIASLNEQIKSRAALNNVISQGFDVTKRIADVYEELAQNSVRLGQTELQSLSTEAARRSLLEAEVAFERDRLDMMPDQLKAAEAYVDSLRAQVHALDSANRSTELLIEKSKGYANVIAAPIDGLKSSIEKLPGGNFLSSALGLESFAADFKQNVLVSMQKGLVEGPRAGISNFAQLTKQSGLLGTVLRAALSPIGLALIAFTALYAVLSNIEKQAKEFANTTGVTVAQATVLADESRKVASSQQVTLAVSKDILDVQGEVAKVFGSTAMISADVAGEVADIGKSFGYGAQQAAQVNTVFMSMGVSAGQAADMQRELAAEAVKSGVNVGTVVKDIAENARSLSKYFGGNIKALKDAAIQAAKMGVSISTMGKVAEKLLDIEGSLAAQFEFQALSGRQINLDKARELALSGKIAEATKEVMGEVGDIAEFNKLSTLEKQKLAEATGMEVDELQKSLTIQSKLGNLTEEQAAAMSGLNLSAAQLAEMSAEEIQNELAKRQAIEKSEAAMAAIKDQLMTALLPLAESFGSLLSALTPILKGIGEAVKFILTPFEFFGKLLHGNVKDMGAFRAIIGAVGAAIIGTWALIKTATLLTSGWKLATGGVSSAYGTIKSGMQSVFDFGKKGFAALTDSSKSYSDRLKSMFTSKKPDAVTPAPADATQGPARDARGRFTRRTPAAAAATESIPATQPEPKSSGEKIKEFLTNLAEGLKAMASSDVLLGALNLIPASVGLVIMIPGVLGAKLIEKINGGKVEESLTGLANGLAAMATGKAALGSLALIAAAAGFTLMTVGAIGMAAVALLGAAAGAGLSALAVGLTSLGTAAASGLPFLGVALLAAFGIALIPLTYALSLLNPIIQTFGDIVIRALGALPDIITAVASGFAQLLGSITFDNIAAIALLGPALASSAYGLGVLAGALSVTTVAALALGAVLAVFNPFDKLIALGDAAPNLERVTQTILKLTTAVSSLAGTLASADFSKLDQIAAPSLATKLLNFGTSLVQPLMANTAEPVAPGISRESQATSTEAPSQSSAEVAGLLQEQNTLLTQILQAIGSPVPVQIGPKVIAELTSVINVENSYRRNR